MLSFFSVKSVVSSPKVGFLFFDTFIKILISIKSKKFVLSTLMEYNSGVNYIFIPVEGFSGFGGFS